MSSGAFKGKESSNRIELSRSVQDLLNFGVLGSLWLLGRRQMGGGNLGARGCLHTCAHTCMHMYTCIEIASGHNHHVYHVYNMHVHVCKHGVLPTHPPPPQSTHLPPHGGPQNQ